MTRWYKLDNTKLTNAEIRRLAPHGVAFVISWLAKTFHRRMRPRFGFRRIDRLDQVEFEDLPRLARRAFRDLLDDCEDSGFRISFCWILECLGDLRGAAIALLNGAGTTWVTLAWTEARVGVSANKEFGAAISSRLDDGTFLTTTNLKKKPEAPREFLGEHQPGATIRDLMDRHAHRLRSDSRVPRVLDAAALVRIAIEIAQRTADWNVSRGIWTQMTDDEVAALRKQTPTFDDD